MANSQSRNDGSFDTRERLNSYKSTADEYVMLRDTSRLPEVTTDGCESNFGYTSEEYASVHHRTNCPPEIPRRLTKPRVNSDKFKSTTNSFRLSHEDVLQKPNSEAENTAHKSIPTDDTETQLPGDVLGVVRNKKTVTLSRKTSEKDQESCDDEIDLEVYCLEEENKLKVVVELTTQEQNEMHPLPVRILLLVDTSGSMGIKYGGRTKPSKLNRMKDFAVSLMDSLDDGDQAALVTFGADANILMPMKGITPTTREQLKRELKKLDKSYLSTKTNLSAGLTKALDAFRQVTHRQSDLLEYRNAIIVFSDGEINDGIREPQKLVHDIREKIRNLSYGLDDSQNQWVTISVIATGSDVSEAMYLLSKVCSSEAFYHLDMDRRKTNYDIFLPVLMRKTAVAWNVSLFVKSMNSAKLINEECTQDGKIRLRTTLKGKDRTQKAYFYYDMQSGSKKHVGLVIDTAEISDDPDVEIAELRVSYTSIKGKRKEIKRVILRGDLEIDDAVMRQKSLEENLKMDVRTVSVAALNKAAENVKSGNVRESSADILAGESDVQKLCEKYGAMARLNTTEEVNSNLNIYAESLMTNMKNLLSAIQTTTGEEQTENSKHWAKIKAVSSAIAREVPTVSETVYDSNVLCPLPAVRQVVSPQMRQQMGHVYKQQGVRDSAFLGELNSILIAQHQMQVVEETDEDDSD